KVRKEMQVELKRLQRTLGITFVFVTHDQEEAMTMSDRIAVMNGGHVEQCEPSSEVFERPRTEFVAQFMGAANFFTGVVKAVDAEHIHVTCATGLETRVRAGGTMRATVADRVKFMVRPEKLSLVRTPPADGRACMEAVVEQRVYQG